MSIKFETEVLVSISIEELLHSLSKDRSIDYRTYKNKSLIEKGLVFVNTQNVNVELTVIGRKFLEEYTSLIEPLKKFVDKEKI